MKKILLSMVAFFAVAQAAFAADLPVKAPRLVAPVDPWSGWYLGVSVGGARLRSCGDYTPQANLPFQPIDSAFLQSIDAGCSSSTGVIGGGQIGFNQRFGGLVWGLEADFSGLSTKANRTATGASPFTGGIYVATQSTTLDRLLTLRPRVGFTPYDNMLLYVTGGFAMAHVSASGLTAGPLPPPQYLGSGNVSQWTPGWTVGAGVEAKFGGPWSVKAEYLYVNLRSVAYDNTQPQINVGTGFDNIGDNLAMSTQLHIFRVGVNYNFGEPVISRAAAMAPVAYNWTGVYVGGHIGGVWGTSHAQEPNQEAVPGAGPWLAFGEAFEAKTNGINGGVQAGVNYQLNMIVLGAEADFGYLGFKGKNSSPLFSGTYVTATGGYYATLRGRLGLAWDRFMVYGTGGLMVADVGATVNNPTIVTLGDGLLFSEKTGTQTGWVVGGGLEYALAYDWSLKGEYLHFDLGTKKIVGQGENFLPPNLYAFDIRNTGDIVRFGLNKKIF